MKTVIEMARKSGYGDHMSVLHAPALERFAELVRADEREQGQRWFDAVTAQHKQAILAEREACAKVCEEYETNNDITATWLNIVADAIRARSNT